jgi:hypothetical protein
MSRIDNVDFLSFRDIGTYELPCHGSTVLIIPRYENIDHIGILRIGDSQKQLPPHSRLLRYRYF